jgi:hypothetical protein
LVVGDVSSLFPGEHGRGLAFQVEVGLAADVDCDPLDGAAGSESRISTLIVPFNGSLIAPPGSLHHIPIARRGP